MPGVKRRRTEDAQNGDDGIHPSRKVRVEQEAGRAELHQIFNNLRDEIPSVRLEATKELLSSLSTRSSDQPQRIDYALTRLIKGVCSGAKASRPGFSVALTEVLNIAFNEQSKDLSSVSALVDKIVALSNPDVKAKGEEARNYLLGRHFALQALLHSQILHSASDSDCDLAFDVIAELATTKHWLRTECGAGLCAYLESVSENKIASKNALALLKSWAAKGLIRSPEGIALWLTCKKAFPDLKLPQGHWHHNDPLSSQERLAVTKILSKNSVDEDDNPNGATKKSGARQAVPNFAWSRVLEYLYNKDDKKAFSHFWSECVAKSMFSTSSSAERKALGLQIFTNALARAPAPFLQDLIHPSIIQCIVDQRANPDRYLFEATKQPLTQMTTRSKKDSIAAAKIALSLMRTLVGNMDKTLKSVFEAAVAASDRTQLESIVEQCESLSRNPLVSDLGDAEKKRRFVADAMLSLVRSRKSDVSQLFKDVHSKPRASNVAEWLQRLIQGLVKVAFCSSQNGPSPPISETSREVFRERIMSIMGHLIALPLQQAIWGPRIVIETLHDSRDDLAVSVDRVAMKALKEGRKLQRDVIERVKKGDASSTLYAFHLLLSLGMLQIYKQEPDSLGVLEDIIACHAGFDTTSNASPTMLVELILSFISKQSGLYRKLAEQIFSAFASEVTADAFESMLDILAQKESMAGQQELFDKHEDSADDGSDSVEGESDIESASDVEIVTGGIAVEDGDSTSEKSNEDDDESSDALAATNEDEEAEFDRKLADALGTAGTDQESDDDGSDMDDDQMMALDAHLTTIFQERKKGANKKQENKDAKENIIHFKSRVLDLFESYVRTQHANALAMELITPLVELTRTTTSQPIAKKALTVLESYFDTCKKNKVLPTVPEDGACIDKIAELLAEARLGGSKLHATACSRSCQFVAKILVARDPAHWVAVAQMYISLQDEWRQDPKSKIHGGILNDWHNWSMQR